MADTFLTYGGRRWLWISNISAVLLIGSYVLYRRAMVPSGGTAMGLAYGLLGTLLILVLMGLGIRKRLYGSAMGTLQGWTSAHVYLGLLTLLVIPLHAGFEFRPDIHTLAFVLLAVVVLSGLLGTVLYVVLPSRLTGFEARVQAENIDKELGAVMNDMRRLARNKSDEFVKVYQAEALGLAAGPFQGWRILFRGGQKDVLADKAAHLSTLVSAIPSPEHAEFQALSALILQKAQLESLLVEQMRLRNALQGWLYVHVPVSIAMVVAVGVHLVVVFYY